MADIVSLRIGALTVSGTRDEMAEILARMLHGHLSDAERGELVRLRSENSVMHKVCDSLMDQLRAAPATTQPAPALPEAK